MNVSTRSKQTNPSTSDNQPKSGTEDWQSHAKHRGRVLHRESLANNVNSYIVEKPEGFEFLPGQAVELAIDQENWQEEKRPFTMTSLPSDPRLEFIVKSYPTEQFPDHDGMTEHLGADINVGDRVLFGDPWGAIQYQGPGVFIAGGAGMTHGCDGAAGHQVRLPVGGGGREPLFLRPG